MATKKCGCRRCGVVLWSLWQNRSTTKHCSKVFGRLSKVERAYRSVWCARRSSVAAVARFGSGDQDRNPRRLEPIKGNSSALESVPEQGERAPPTHSTVL